MGIILRYYSIELVVSIAVETGKRMSEGYFEVSEKIGQMLFDLPQLLPF